MRFLLLDRIAALEPGKSITAIKNLTSAEEYLADHFPLFPVMPGVLMLEAMTQAGAWLIRASENFSHSMVTLAEARHIRYADFVRPGHTLEVTAEIVSTEGPLTTLKAQGRVEGSVNVSARLILKRYNLADENPSYAGRDEKLKERLRDWFALLCPPEVISPVAAEDCRNEAEPSANGHAAVKPEPVPAT